MLNPIKPTIKTEILPILIIILASLASIYFYPLFPEQVPIHWNFQGEPDNWGSAKFAAFFFPVIIMGMYLLFLFIPYIDPKKERYDQFKNVYHIFKVLLILFMAAIYFISSFNAIGYNISINTWVPSMVGLLFIVLGNYMSKIKFNWFIGIRTPWTLSNEEVWNKTHRFGGKVFIFAGLLFILGQFSPDNFRAPLFIVSVAIVLLGTIGYSYLAYLKEEKKKN